MTGWFLSLSPTLFFSSLAPFSLFISLLSFSLFLFPLSSSVSFPFLYQILFRRIFTVEIPFLSNFSFKCSFFLSPLSNFLSSPLFSQTLSFFFKLCLSLLFQILSSVFLFCSFLLFLSSLSLSLFVSPLSSTFSLPSHPMLQSFFVFFTFLCNYHCFSTFLSFSAVHLLATFLPFFPLTLPPFSLASLTPWKPSLQSRIPVSSPTKCQTFYQIVHSILSRGAPLWKLHRRRVTSWISRRVLRREFWKFRCDRLYIQRGESSDPACSSWNIAGNSVDLSVD